MFSQYSFADDEKVSDVVYFDKDRSRVSLHIPEKGLDQSSADEVLGFFKANQGKIREITCTHATDENHGLINNILLQLIATILREDREIIVLAFTMVDGSDDIHPGMEMLARALLDRGVGLKRLFLYASNFGDSYLPLLDALRELETSRGMLQSFCIGSDIYTVKALEAINRSIASFSQLRELSLDVIGDNPLVWNYTNAELKLSGEGLLSAFKTARAKLTHLTIDGMYPIANVYTASLVSWLETEAGEDLEYLNLLYSIDSLHGPRAAFIGKIDTLISLNRRPLKEVPMQSLYTFRVADGLVYNNFHITSIGDYRDQDEDDGTYSATMVLATKRNQNLEKLSLILTKLQAGVLSLAQHPRIGVDSPLYVSSDIHQLIAETLARANEVNNLEELKAFVAANIMYPNPEVQKLVREVVIYHDKLAAEIGDDNLILLPVSDRPADMIVASRGSSDTDNSSESSPSDDDSAPTTSLFNAGACDSSISSYCNILAIKNETPKVIANQSKLAITRDSNFTALVVSSTGVEKPRFVENLKAFTAFKRQLNGFFQLIFSSDIKEKEFLSELIDKMTNSSELTDDQKKELLEDAKRIDDMLSPNAIVSSMEEFFTRTEDGFSENNKDELCKELDSTLLDPHPMALIMHKKYAMDPRNFGFNHLTGMAK